MQQTFLFKHDSIDQIRHCLLAFASLVTIDERPGFFVFAQLPGKAAFTFDCEVIDGGLRSKRSGEYFAFLGLFVETLSGQFGALVIEDC